MKPVDQNGPFEGEESTRHLKTDSFRLKLGEVGEKSLNGNEQAKIKVDTDLYSHYIE